MGIASTLLITVFVSGCAFNDHGLVRVRRFENETAVLLRLTMIGAHLVTYPGDAGLTLGYSDRTYVFPRGDATVRVPVATLLDTESQQRLGALRPADGSPAVRLDTPVMRVARTAGLSFDSNRNRAGLALGFSHRAAVWLPTDGSRVVIIRYSSGDEAGAHVIIDQEGNE